MPMNIRCPGCDSALMLPEQAVGRHARCNHCHTEFIVPDPQEDAFSSWIEEGVEEELDQRHHDIEQKLDDIVDRTREQRERELSRRRRAAERRAARETASKDDAALTDDDLRAIEKFGSPAKLQEKDSSPAPATNLRPPPPPEPETVAKPARRKPAPVRPGRAAAPAAETVHVRRHDVEIDPQQLRLYVLDCSADGVRLGFDSRWLAHLGFRASMPYRCAVSGSVDVGELLVRGLRFTAPPTGGASAPHVTHHDLHLRPDQSLRDLVRTMEPLRGVPEPFHWPLPYFISTQHSHESVVCVTTPHGQDAATCEIVIPDGQCALEWLGRVNGVCGDDYEQLRRDLYATKSSAWAHLDDRTRGRISAWCAIRPRERFDYYIEDCDLGHHDAGLAGIVGTDQRIVFHKYHHEGSLERTDEGKFHLRHDQQFVAITLDTPDHRTRIGRFREAEIDPLLEQIEGTEPWEVEES